MRKVFSGQWLVVSGQWLLLLGLAVMPAAGDLLPRQIPDVTGYTKGLLTNETAASSRAYLGIEGGLVAAPQRLSLKLQYPRRVDGAGCTYANTNDFTAADFMVPRFSGTGATNANFCQWGFRVPNDLDTSVDLTASLTVQKNGTDTNGMVFTVGMVSIPAGAAAAGTAANYVSVPVTPASGTSGAVESSGSITLTGWRANLTAGQWCVVQLRRDGAGDANEDSADGLELELFYTATE